MAKTLPIQVKCSIDVPLSKALRNHAKREGSSESRIMRLAIRDYLARQK